MATQTTANPASMADQFQTLFSNKMLKHRTNMLRLAGLSGVKHEADIGMNHGNYSIRLFKKRAGDSSQVQSLTEGTPINTFTELATGYVDATLEQIGEAGRFSDIVKWTAIFNWASQFIETLGEDAALKLDDTIRNSIVTGMQDINSRFEQFAGVPYTGDGDDDFASLAALAAHSAKMTSLQLLNAITTLKAGLCPLIGGGAVAVIAPQVMADLRQDQDWKDAATHVNTGKLYNMGEEYMMHGVRVVEATNPFRENVYGTHTAAGAVYSNFVFGRGAFGVPKLTGAGNPTKPEIIVLRNPDKSDPLGQLTYLGWKSVYTSKLMLTNLAGDVPNVVNIRAKATYDL